MIAIDWVVAIAIAAAQAGAGGVGAQGSSPSIADARKTVREGEVDKADAEAFIARCGSRKFETEVMSNNGGKLRKAKILLCAKPADSDEEWIATLDKAATQIGESPQLSAEAKAKVIAEIQAAIGLVRGVQGAQAQPAVASPTAREAGPGVAELAPAPPPMPEPIVATVRPLPPPPAPKPIAVPRAPVSKPPLSISCSEAGGPGGGGDCGELTAATLLTVRAAADVTSKVSLRFIRDGDPRGGIALGTMRRGQVIRARLPARVCSGVVRGRVMLQTIVIDPNSRAEQIADTKGPLLLRC